MTTIPTNNLLEAPITLRPDENMLFGERVLPVDTQTVLELTDEHTAQLANAMALGLDAFGSLERTKALEITGRPTLIARVDCTLDPATGKIHPYEVEERPAGMGVIDGLHQRVVGRQFGKPILSHLEARLGSLPVVKRHPNAKENDDGLLLPVEVFTDTKVSVKNRDVLVRAEPADMAGHPQLAEVTARAIAPILEKGKRQYRIATGFAELVTVADLLPAASPKGPGAQPSRSYVLKTLQGSKATGVKICLSNEDAKKHGNRDITTRAKASALLEATGAVLLENFVPSIPVATEDGRMANMILRVFGLVSSDSIQVIGGAYMARPGHLVHGSKDAISGVVLASEVEV